MLIKIATIIEFYAYIVQSYIFIEIHNKIFNKGNSNLLIKMRQKVYGLTITIMLAEFKLERNLIFKFR